MWQCSCCNWLASEHRRTVPVPRDMPYKAIARQLTRYSMSWEGPCAYTANGCPSGVVIDRIRSAMRDFLMGELLARHPEVLARRSRSKPLELSKGLLTNNVCNYSKKHLERAGQFLHAYMYRSRGTFHLRVPLVNTPAPPDWALVGYKYAPTAICIAPAHLIASCTFHEPLWKTGVRDG